MTSTNDIRVNPIFFWIILVFNFIITFSWVFMKMSEKPLPHELVVVAITLRIVVDILLIYDIFINNITNRRLWITSLFVFHTLGVILYLIKRKYLLSKVQ